jgi:carbon monoxide dehydrogenase subunit G
MLIEGKFTLSEAPIQDVWDFLLKPETLAACIPGAQEIKAIDDRTYDCVVKQRVGPIGVTLKFRVALTELKAPTYLKASGQGADVMKAGTFTLEMEINLTEAGNNQVEISYKVNVSLVGRIATFGERIMRAKTKSVGDEMTANLQAKLKSQLAAKK